MRVLKSGRKAKIRRQTLQLVSMLSRWCRVREDLLYAFEKCMDGGLENPTSQAVKDLVIRVKGGMPVDQALDLMQQSVDQEQFSDLVGAIRFNFHYRGDLPILLEQLEYQMNKIEEEFERRRLSNARDCRLTLLILLAVPVFLVVRMICCPGIRMVFLASSLGRILLLIGFVCYALAIGCFWLVRRRIDG